MFEKVLVANRGVIACRVIRTLKKMGIRSVAVYSEADVQSPHVLAADEGVCIGAPQASKSYLSFERILEAAKSTGAQAVHPGYGFLSENADFAEACENAGLVFIGPTPAQMRAFGLKHTAREIAGSSGVPLLPGTGLVADAEAAARKARRIGYPVILKSTAGCGGTGMRVCRGEDQIEEAFAAVERLGKASFKQGGLFIEKFVDRARHIEVQIFGDGEGKVIALGERDCSTQRRNQKLIEETPAPRLRAPTRQLIFDAALRLGEAVQYRNAGTVEFIHDVGTGEFYFLGVNTRLQAEHGVTEEVTGVDLVEWMVRVARGEGLPRPKVKLEGCSIQVRIYAENPSRDFRPCSGIITLAEFPRSARIETWIERGIKVTTYYDPLLAKIIVRAGNRDEAVVRMRDALAATRIDGLETNLEYLRQVAESAEFQNGELATGFLRYFNYSPSEIETIAGGTQRTI